MKREQIKREVQEVVNKWQPLLGLSKWKIDVFVVGGPEMSRATGCDFALAYCNPNAFSQSASIFIHAGVKWTLDDLGKYESLQVTALHELLHVSMHSTGVQQGLETLAAIPGGREYANMAWDSLHPLCEIFAVAMLKGAIADSDGDRILLGHEYAE